LRVGWLPGRFREQPLDHLFDLAVQSAMRKAIRRALLGLQLGPPKQNFVTYETDGNDRFAMQKSEAVSVSDGSFTIHPFSEQSAPPRRSVLGQAEIFFSV
jgi:hypothetical protein